jgi:uncharacterized protein YjlB
VTLRPTGILETPDGNLYTVIDDIDTESVVLIPMSYGHRRLAKREDLGAEGVLHEGRSAGVQTGRPEYSIVSRAGLSPLAAERDSDADSGGGEDDRVV